MSTGQGPSRQGPSDPRSYAAMTALTRAVERLNAHMEDADRAVQQRSRQTLNDQQVADRTVRPQQGVNVPPSWASRAAPLGTSASTPANVDETFRQQLSRQAEAAQSGQNESTPPGVAPERDTLSNVSHQDALTWAVLGEHAGPFGRVRMAQYSLERNLGWGQRVVEAAQNRLGSASDQLDVAALNNPDVQAGGDLPRWYRMTSAATGGASSGLGGINQALNWAQSPSGQAKTLGAIAAYRAGVRVSNMTNDWREAGLRLGYGGPNSPGMGFWGFNNPAAQFDATRQGASLALERQSLMGRVPGVDGFGTGLRRDQATEAVSTLAAQGFSNRNMVSGDNYTIAQNLMAPLMNMGMRGQDIAQWTPALRNANTSIQQLMGSLSQIPQAARTAKETVADFSAGLEQLAQTQVSQGGTIQGAAQTGVAFNQATGMAPGVFGQMSQSPLYTGIMMQRYGVLPSMIPNLPGGAQVGGTLSTLSLLSRAFAGLNRNQYENVPGVGRVQTASGQTAVEAQVGQQMGLSQSDVHRLLGQMPRDQAIATGQTRLGEPSMGAGQPGSGIYQFLGGDAGNRAVSAQHVWGRLSRDQQMKATRMFNWAETDQTMRQQGLTPSEIQRIQRTPNVVQRTRMLQDDWRRVQSSSPYNQIGNHQNQVTVGVKFTGAAAKIFQQSSPGMLKLMSGAGGTPMNAVLNSPSGMAMSAQTQSFGDYMMDTLGHSVDEAAHPWRLPGEIFNGSR